MRNIRTRLSLTVSATIAKVKPVAMTQKPRWFPQVKYVVE